MAQGITEKGRALLEAPNFCHVATLRRDGSAHGVLVWVDVDDDTVVLNTAKGRAWEQNLRRDPRITLTIPDHENPYTFLSVRGRAEFVDEGADEHIDRMARKYLGQDAYPFRQPGEQRVIVRVQPEWAKVQGG